ncbi:hypothetical protein GKZ90_0003475 [Flavobacterium sp. MC2016-06]|jgi:hypothetical protein|uniref:hypothetical protein n=1 Tax=Flavobacterium sp. MC2016-06 TaxID=2676308 RepID=UPI0012BAEBE6|nr:hypothetical protein [Flavobacterium sp. MC2016-06]MBU3859705.1 hypothetical protein [Flavobacterium sp. MC2016-06]
MKNLFVITSLLWCSFLLAQQSILQPPENIKLAFEKQYPKKKPIWSLELGNNDNDIKFIASFIQSPNVKAVAVYDNKGAFKAYKAQILMTKLPKNTIKYLAKEYPKSVKQTLSVVDDKNVETYEVVAIKDKKYYKIIFDKSGDLKNRIQIE